MPLTLEPSLIIPLSHMTTFSSLELKRCNTALLPLGSLSVRKVPVIHPTIPRRVSASRVMTDVVYPYLPKGCLRSQYVESNQTCIKHYYYVLYSSCLENIFR